MLANDCHVVDYEEVGRLVFISRADLGEAEHTGRWGLGEGEMDWNR